MEGLLGDEQLLSHLSQRKQSRSNSVSPPYPACQASTQEVNFILLWMNDGDSRELHGTTAETFYSDYMDWLEKRACPLIPQFTMTSGLSICLALMSILSQRCTVSGRFLESLYSLLDVGCGTGSTLVEAHNCRVAPTVGIEIYPLLIFRVLSTHFDLLIHDLREPLDLNYRFDHVYCWEVAEHLPEESADTLCDTLAGHTGKYLIYSAAHEDQGGQYHLNEQDSDYWIVRMEDRGLTWRNDLTNHLEDIWDWTTGPMHWLPENVLVFERKPLEDIKNQMTSSAWQALHENRIPAI